MFCSQTPFSHIVNLLDIDSKGYNKMQLHLEREINRKHIDSVITWRVTVFQCLSKTCPCYEIHWSQQKRENHQWWKVYRSKWKFVDLTLEHMIRDYWAVHSRSTIWGASLNVCWSSCRLAPLGTPICHVSLNDVIFPRAWQFSDAAVMSKEEGGRGRRGRSGLINVYTFKAFTCEVTIGPSWSTTDPQSRATCCAFSWRGQTSQPRSSVSWLEAEPFWSQPPDPYPEHSSSASPVRMRQAVRWFLRHVFHLYVLIFICAGRQSGHILNK